jgi:hypothetical protein
MASSALPLFESELTINFDTKLLRLVACLDSVRVGRAMTYRSSFLTNPVHVRRQLSASLLPLLNLNRPIVLPASED